MKHILKQQNNLTWTPVKWVMDRVYSRQGGAQWLSNRVLDSRLRGRRFESHLRHCVLVLEQDTFILAYRGFIKRREAGTFPFYSGMFPVLLLINLYRVYRQILSNHPPTLPWCLDAKKVNETPELSTGSTQEDQSLFDWKIVDGT